MSAVRARGILFSVPMVRAILAGTKSQTRRIAKTAPGYDHMTPPMEQCPYGKPGDRLWVRETWAPLRIDGVGDVAAYRATCENDCFDALLIDGALLSVHVRKWKPSIFMPRLASRITLEVTEVRVQRLQDITEEDAKAEGVRACTTCRDAFARLWDELNGERASWSSNPWVWCVTFSVEENTNGLG